MTLNMLINLITKARIVNNGMYECVVSVCCVGFVSLEIVVR